MKNQKPIPELPNQLEMDFQAKVKRKNLEQYVQQNAGIRLAATDMTILNSSKLDWVKNEKIHLGFSNK